MFFLGLILSAGMHTAVIARVHLPGEQGYLYDPPGGFELRYMDVVELSNPTAPSARAAVCDGGVEGPLAAPAPEETEPGAVFAHPVGAAAVAARTGARRGGEARLAPELMRGTGEVLRASVQETLRPLLGEGNPRDAAFNEAVRRYKLRLEYILDKESRLAYPRPAREDGREARLQIRFSLRNDGSLESIELPPSCGGFEQELIAGLKNAAKHFPAFPDEIRCARLTFCWPVSFNLY